MSTSSLFRRPFAPKKAPPRKATTISPLQMDAAERGREFLLDYTHAHMFLGNEHFSFDPETGDWYNDNTGQNYTQQLAPNSNKMNIKNITTSMTKEAQKIYKESQQLQEENNLLKVKNEILIDMVAELCSEYGLEEKKKKGKK